MTEDSENVDPQLWRRAAEGELTSATHSRNVLLEAHQDAYKWLLASLLAINGAGMLAVFNAAGLNASGKITAAVFFYLGIISALLSTYLSQRAHRLMIGPLGEAMGYWISVAHDGEHVPEIWEAINTKIQRAVRRSWPIQAAGWVSAVCFSAGLLAVGMNLQVSRSAPASEIHVETKAR
jgi:hypothetical protein